MFSIFKPKSDLENFTRMLNQSNHRYRVVYNPDYIEVAIDSGDGWESCFNFAAQDQKLLPPLPANPSAKRKVA